MKIVPHLFLTCFFTLAFSANAADWPRWRGPDANGISKETGWSAQWPAEGPKQLWKAKVGIGFSSVSVSKGRVFTMGNVTDKDTVFCFDANTGKEVWKFSYPEKLDPKYYEGGPSATPTVDGDRVFTISKSGVVHCLDAAKGTVVWSTNLAKGLKAEAPTWGFSGSVLVDGDLCIVNVGSAGTALDKKTSKKVWSWGTDAAGYSTPVPVDWNGERAVVMFIKADVAAIRAKDGKILWRHPWQTEYDVNAADPIISGKKIFITAGYNHGNALLDVSSGQPKVVWENKNLRMHFNCPVLWNGHIYGIDENQLRCIVFDTGEVKWTDKSSGKGSLMLADGKLIVLSEKGELMVADATPDGFKPISRAQVLGGKCWSVPVLANGKIYCRNAAGDEICLDVGGK